jgi:superfamily II DNA/RNA helicase
MLFSATMPSEVITLARRYMRHPVNIRAESPDETATVPTTAQFVYRAHRMDKDEVLARILQAENRGLAMLFARTKRQTQAIADELSRRGFSVGAVHGDLNQQARERALSAFRQGTVDVLVCTDVAARGIDVDGVTHVVNVTCPEDEKTYLHRIGRTGRAGASGVAITLVDWDDMSRWSGINTALGLPYPEPQETYSTSEHLYHDLGIPSGAGGALASATGQASGGATRPTGRSHDRQESTDSPGSGKAGGHGRRSRSRSRSTSRSSSGSGGERPTSGSPAAGSPSTAASTDAPGSTPGGGSETSSDSSSPRRRRQRRRTRGGKPTDSGSD